MPGWLGDLGSMRGDRGCDERRTKESVLAEGEKMEHRTALERFIFTSSRTARLQLTKALDAVKN